jgi:hypothetical protein
MPRNSGSGVSRRDFVKTTGAGALAVGLRPFFLFPDGQQVVSEAAVQELKKQLRGSCFVLAMKGLTRRERCGTGWVISALL